MDLFTVTMTCTRNNLRRSVKFVSHARDETEACALVREFYDVPFDATITAKLRHIACPQQISGNFNVAKKYK